MDRCTYNVVDYAMQITVSRSVAWDSAHRLHSSADSPKCLQMHGHRWTLRGRWTCNASALTTEGMAVNFVLIKELLSGLAAIFDHQLINEIELPAIDCESMGLMRWSFDDRYTADVNLLAVRQVVVMNPTAELLGLWCYAWLEARTRSLLPATVRLTSISLWETPDSEVLIEGAR